MLYFLLEHASLFDIKGENLDPDGICGTIIKQDQFAEPFEIPPPPHETQHYEAMRLNKPIMLLQQIIQIDGEIELEVKHCSS